MRNSMVAATAVLLIAVAASSAETPALSRQEFKQTLERIADSLSQASPSHTTIDPSSLPDVWIVRDRGTEFRVSTMWLRSGVVAMNSAPSDRDTLRTALIRRIKALEAASEAGAQPATYTAERDRLQAILARREFSKVHGPTWLDELRQKIIQILVEWLARIFGTEVAPELGKIFVWLVIIAAVGVLGWWARRLLVRPAGAPSIATGVVVVSPKDWRAWLSEAHRAADAQQWRDAIRLAYWAGVYSLEERGMWRTDRARTPREYLRQADTTSPFLVPLGSLTAVFERTWYAGDPADALAYARANAALESMECR